MSTINRRIAGRLEEAADLPQAQGADRFRVNAYRRAAAAVRSWPEPFDQTFRSLGLAGLERVPGVGPGIAGHGLHRGARIVAGREGEFERSPQVNQVPDEPHAAPLSGPR